MILNDKPAFIKNSTADKKLRKQRLEDTARIKKMIERAIEGVKHGQA